MSWSYVLRLSALLLQENLLGQKFIVDATLFVDLQKAGESDNVHDTVSYADVYRHVNECKACLGLMDNNEILWRYDVLAGTSKR